MPRFAAFWKMPELFRGVRTYRPSTRRLIDPTASAGGHLPARLSFRPSLGLSALITTTTAKRHYPSPFFLDPPRGRLVLSLLAGIISANGFSLHPSKCRIATLPTFCFSYRVFFGTTPSVLFHSTAASAWVFGSTFLTLPSSLLSLYTFLPFRSAILAGGKLIASLGTPPPPPPRTSAGIAFAACASLHISERRHMLLRLWHPSFVAFLTSYVVAWAGQRCDP